MQVQAMVGQMVVFSQKHLSKISEVTTHMKIYGTFLSNLKILAHIKTFNRQSLVILI